jgi:hypothetical protein
MGIKNAAFLISALVFKIDFNGVVIHSFSVLIPDSKTHINSACKQDIGYVLAHNRANFYK